MKADIMTFRNHTNDQIKGYLIERSVVDVDSVVASLVDLVRQHGSTTGNLEDFCFEVELKPVQGGFAKVKSMREIPCDKKRYLNRR